MDRKIKRIISLVLVFSIVVLSMPVKVSDAKKKRFKLTSTERYYYTKGVNWGLVHNSNHKKPGGSAPFSGFSMKKFDAMYVYHPKKKEIYLTFDCGYDNGNTKKVLDILKKKKVKAIFFITGEFLKEKPKLVKRMKREGHLVGNHTMNHPYPTKCSESRLKGEITSLAKMMKKKTGYKMDKFFRPPYGNYSIKTLNIARKLGYKTVFWSLAWYDWDDARQPSVSSVVNQFRRRYHKGMIPLLHIVSSADTRALPGIISFMKKKGYTFRLFTDKYKKKPAPTPKPTPKPTPTVMPTSTPEAASGGAALVV